MSSETPRSFEPVGDQRFRILSLDGGGVKGVFAASFLATWEDMAGKRIADYFDLISGTSTGGIIALSLGLGFSGRQILEFYLDHGAEIFPVTGLKRSIRHVFRHKHAPEQLEASLRKVLGDRRLGESSTRLVIPSYNAVAGDIKLFKTSHHPRFKRDHHMRARDVALATSAAPTFFPPHEQVFIDGGVWANNPVAVALSEAIGVLQASPTKVEVLSIGTTSEPYHVPERLRRAGLLRWLFPIKDLLLQAQQAGAMGLAHAVTEHERRLVRIDEKTIPGRFRLDDATGMAELDTLGSRTAEHSEKRLSPRFLDAPTPRFVPYHKTTD